MDVCISHVQLWYPHCEELSLQQALNNTNIKPHNWPTLDFVPAIQRRRLSPFAKMALYVANKTAETEDIQESLPIIFSSRHGDLHKTSELLNDLSTDTPLSPTAFSLSVHNAIPSLYSILTNNKQALNAISAAQDTFLMSITDAYARLTTKMADKILLIHADQQLPDTYLGFKDETQISHALAMVISLPTDTTSDQAQQVSITMKNKTPIAKNSHHIPSALTFAQWFQSPKSELEINTTRYIWSINKKK